MARQRQKQAKPEPVIEAPSGSERSRTWLICAVVLLVLVATIPFVFAFRGAEFVLDDRPLILRDPLVHNIENIPKAFTIGFLKDFDEKPYYYRPLVTILYAVNYAMFGANPAGFKATNLLLHVIVVLLVFALARRLLKNDVAALFTGLLFAVLPSHTECVSWISGRTDLMAAAFGFASFILYLKYVDCRKWPQFALSVVLFVLAVLSKEIAMVLPAMMVLHALILRRPKPTARTVTAEVAPFVAITLLYFVVRHVVLGYSLSQHGVSFVLQHRLTLAGWAMLGYFRILLIPTQAEPVHDIFNLPLRVPALAVAAWGITVAMFAGAIAIYRKYPIISFCCLWMLLGILPVTNIVPIPNPIPSERFLYVPSFGLCVLFGLAVNWLFALKPKPVQDIWPVVTGLVAAGVLGYCALLSSAAAPLWSNNILMVQRLTQRLPRFADFHMLAAGAYRESNRYMEAIEECKIAAEITPKNPLIHRTLVDLYRRVGDPKSAAAAARVLVELQPAEPSVHNLLGSTLAESGEMAEAVKEFKRAVELSPEDPAARFNLARAYTKTNQLNSAVTEFLEGLRFRPDDTKARYQLGAVLKDLGRSAEAREQWSLAAKGTDEYASLAAEALADLSEPE